MWSLDEQVSSISADSASSELATGNVNGTVTIWDSDGWKAKCTISVNPNHDPVEFVRYGRVKASNLPASFLMVCRKREGEGGRERRKNGGREEKEEEGRRGSRRKGGGGGRGRRREGGRGVRGNEGGGGRKEEGGQREESEGRGEEGRNEGWRRIEGGREKEGGRKGKEWRGCVLCMLVQCGTQHAMWQTNCS